MAIDKTELLGMHLEAVDRLSRFGPGTIITVLDPSAENYRSTRMGFLSGTLDPLAAELRTDGIPGTLGVHAEVQDMFLSTQQGNALEGNRNVAYGECRVVGRKKQTADDIGMRRGRAQMPVVISTGFYTVIR